jgi:hypothetical protein
MINQTPTQSASNNDTPPVVCKQKCSYDDSDEEVPSTVPNVRPSNMLDFEEDDEGDETFEDTIASSSDEEDVSLAVVEKKTRLEAMGQKRRQQAREARR